MHAFISFGKYVLESSLLLDTQALPNKNRKVLLHVFDEIKNEKLPSLLEQLRSKNPVRVKMDKAILKVLGYNEKRIGEMLDYLYPALAKEIEQLKTLMAG